MARLIGKTALITGAARGQGRSHALTLAREGADIIAVDIADQIATVPYAMSTKADLDETVALIEGLDRRAIGLQVDTRDQSQLDAAVATGIDTFGQIDILVANAGIWSLGSFWEYSEAEWTDMIDVVLGGTWRTAKAITPHMISRRQGVITMTASVAGLEAGPGFAHYTAAKHGVIGLMRTVAVELAPYNIRCNAVCPGFIDTLMNDWPGCYDMMAGHPDGTPQDRADAARNWSALAGSGLIPPNAISNAILWLVSDEASLVTGIAVPVDAGHLALPSFNPAPTP